MRPCFILLATIAVAQRSEDDFKNCENWYRDNQSVLPDPSQWEWCAEQCREIVKDHCFWFQTPLECMTMHWPQCRE